MLPKIFHSQPLHSPKHPKYMLFVLLCTFKGHILQTTHNLHYTRRSPTPVCAPDAVNFAEIKVRMSRIVIQVRKPFLHRSFPNTSSAILGWNIRLHSSPNWLLQLNKSIHYTPEDLCVYGGWFGIYGSNLMVVKQVWMGREVETSTI